MKWNWILEAKKQVSEEKRISKFANGGSLSGVLVYPDTYFTGMSNLGFHAVYRIFNEELGISCERAFYPDKKYVDFFRNEKNLRSFESQKILQEFDFIAFSISFEMNIPLVVDILKMTSIPLYSVDRTDSDPLILLGGAVSYINPEPVALFVDAILIGRGEDVLPKVSEILNKRLSRNETLVELSKLKNVYVPSLMKLSDVERAKCRTSRFFSSSFLTSNTEFANTLLVEIMRGCPFMCKFCTVSNCFGKCIFNHASDFIDHIESIRKDIDINKVGLIGGSINAHPEFNEILGYLRKNKIKVGFSSLRADRLNDEILDFIKNEGGGILTLAPETANEKIRFAIGKKITDELFFSSVEKAFFNGVSHLRLYFMIGLPNETEDDVREIGNMISKLRKFKNGSKARISVSVSQFIPKPFTPLERERQEDLNSIKKKFSILKSVMPSGVKLSGEAPNSAMLQGILSRGDRNLSKIIAEIPEMSLGKWQKKAESLGIDLEYYLRKIPDDEELFWKSRQRYVDGEDITLDIKEIEEEENFFKTEEDYLYFLFLKEEYYPSLEEFKEWIRWSLNPQLDNYKEWKDLLIKHGYINEKEEIIYKKDE